MGIAALVATALAPMASHAADWPQKPVTVVVPFAAGGNTDTMARMASQRLTEKLGQTFVVENKAGAGGSIAMTQVARAPADGYTLTFAAAPQIHVVPRLQSVNYDPMNDFKPISIFGTGPFILAVHKSVPATTLKDFVTYTKANPGKLTYASGGNGSVSHLASALFVAKLGIQGTHVPYRGGGPAVADLIAGHVHMYFGNASELIQAQASGQVVLLAVSTAQRMPTLPNLPTVAEVIPDFEVSAWNGFMAPKNTPEPVIALLAKELMAIVKEPEIDKRLKELGIAPIGNSPAEFAATMKSNDAAFAAGVKAADIKP